MMLSESTDRMVKFIEGEIAPWFVWRGWEKQEAEHRLLAAGFEAAPFGRWGAPPASLEVDRATMGGLSLLTVLLVRQLAQAGIPTWKAAWSELEAAGLRTYHVGVAAQWGILD